jgi:cytochrome c oxidase subunit III
MQPVAEQMPEQTKIATPKIVLWVALASIVMLFAGLTSGYMVRQAEGNWEIFDIPKAFYISTGMIIASSVSMILAQRSARKNKLSDIKFWMITTLGLGLAFIFSQFLGYNALVAQGVYLSGGNISGSFFYIITALHAAHVIGGILALIFTSAKSVLDKYNSTNYLGMELCATYWHFMGFLWLYLFVFLAAIR